MTPLAYYHQQINENSITEDEAQLAVIEQLNIVHANLLKEHDKRARLFSKLRKPKSVQGLYMCGGVGIGKTMMMDCFYHTVTFKEKLRMHFHPFMRMIHRELKAYQGQKNPIKHIAKKLAKKHMLICFDEFFVNDITDAMILARLLEALFANGVTLVSTSNVLPDDLYKRGLQRELFLPAIDLIKSHSQVCHIPATKDYRERHLSHAGVFFIPNDDEAKLEMDKSFQLLAADKPVSTEPVMICRREINVIKQADDVVWFEFNDICRPPRSQLDYLEIAEKYNTVFMSNVPVMPPEANDRISLFIKLVDVFYDEHVRLVLSAEDGVERLYQHGRLLFEYTRACSRLQEMQSDHYFFKLSL